MKETNWLRYERPTDRLQEAQAPERVWVELRTQHAFGIKPDPYIETVEYVRADLATLRLSGKDGNKDAE